MGPPCRSGPGYLADQRGVYLQKGYPFSEGIFESFHSRKFCDPRFDSGMSGWQPTVLLR